MSIVNESEMNWFNYQDIELTDSYSNTKIQRYEDTLYRKFFKTSESYYVIPDIVIAIMEYKSISVYTDGIALLLNVASRLGYSIDEVLRSSYDSLKEKNYRNLVEYIF